jgi:hypothetical protein
MAIYNTEQVNALRKPSYMLSGTVVLGKTGEPATRKRVRLVRGGAQ